jgi:steroid 5-alpha reductase family enzyme
MIQLLAVAMVGFVVFMLAGWAYQRARNNGGWTDVFWSFGMGLAGAACALFPLDGAPTPRQWLVAALVGGWSLRIGLHIAVRVARSGEDARYRRLREDWGKAFQLRMALFLPGQAILSIPLVGAVMLAARRPGDSLGPADLAGVLILAVAVLGEGLADRQLDAFKADPAHQGQVCDVGLWSWSRHPNYFFEWLGWLAYPVIAIDLKGAYPEGWLSLGAPLTMWLLLNFLSGVPPLEAHMLRSRGEAFRDYQRRTSAFFPLPPRRKGA